MHIITFPMYYSCRYDESPVYDWLKDFEAWLKDASYTVTPMRTHICVARSTLEKHAPVARDARFSAFDLSEMFSPFKQNLAYRATEGVFAKFLRSCGQWLDTSPTGQHVDLIQAYRHHGKEMRGLSDVHMDRQVTIISEFLDKTVTAEHPLADVGLKDIDHYVEYCAQYLARETLMQRIGYLRCFFRFCHDRDVTRFCPDQIDTPRKYRDEKPPRAIAWEMTQKLLDSIDRSTPDGERDYAILFLIANFGLRTGEITSLTVDSIDWKKHVINIFQSKTRSTLSLPMTVRVELVLKNYLQRGRPQIKRSELFLTVVAPTNPVTTSAISEIFQRRVKKSGLPLGNESPYGLRHGFAMRLLEQGVGMKAIGDLLGHNCLESTSVYLRLHTEALRDVALSMPKGTVIKGDCHE